MSEAPELCDNCVVRQKPQKFGYFCSHSSERLVGSSWRRTPSDSCPFVRLDNANAEIERLREDAGRIDALEAELWSDAIHNGIAIFPSIGLRSGLKGVMLQDLGDEDGSCLGEELTGTCGSLRDAIDELRAALQGGE